MNIEKIRSAEKEAKEFLLRINSLMKEQGEKGYYWGSPETASVRRQSMELTRSLANLRKS